MNLHARPLPTTYSLMSMATPTVKVNNKYDKRKTEPPLFPAKYGNFQIAPKPTAGTGAGENEPKRDVQEDATAMIESSFFQLLRNVTGFLLEFRVLNYELIITS